MRMPEWVDPVAFHPILRQRSPGRVTYLEHLNKLPAIAVGFCGNPTALGVTLGNGLDFSVCKRSTSGVIASCSEIV